MWMKAGKRVKKLKTRVKKENIKQSMLYEKKITEKNKCFKIKKKKPHFNNFNKIFRNFQWM